MDLPLHIQVHKGTLITLILILHHRINSLYTYLSSLTTGNLAPIVFRRFIYVISVPVCNQRPSSATHPSHAIPCSPPLDSNVPSRALAFRGMPPSSLLGSDTPHQSTARGDILPTPSLTLLWDTIASPSLAMVTTFVLPYSVASRQDC